MPDILIRQIGDMHADVVSDMEPLDAVSAAAAFGGLLLLPELQSNALRLELLVHLALSYGLGIGQPLPF